MRTNKYLVVGVAICLAATIGVGFSSCKKDEPTPVIVENPLDAEVFYISGKVTSGNVALSGVNVSASKSETTTSDEGTFQLEFTSRGDYAVTFAKEGYVTVTAKINIPADAPKQSIISIKQELTEKNPAVTVTPDSEQIVVEIKREMVELAFSAGSVKTSTDVTVTDFNEGTKSIEEGTVRASLSTVNCEPDGLQFNKPVVFRMKNPMGNALYFANVKHYIQKDGVWNEEGNTEYNESCYHVTTINGFSDHSFGISCTSQKGSSNNEELASVVVDNLGDMNSKEQQITVNQHIGWKVNGVTNDVLKNQLPGIGDSSLTALSEMLENAFSSLMGGAPGISEIPLVRQVKVSGDTKTTVALIEKTTIFMFGFPVIFNGQLIVLNLSVIKYERVDVGVITELGPSHGGSHSGGLIE